jgi:acetyl esterase
VLGDSAGGNLAAVCTQTARDLGGPDIALQVLVYPVTDHNFETSSYCEYASGYPLGRAEMMWFWDQYLGDTAARSDPRVSPLLARDLSGLPPALVIVAEYDPLRDEVLAYARRLRESGVAVSVDHFGDVVHGFFTLATYLQRGDEAVRQVARVIRAINVEAAK